jgi:hypothetical protein
MKRRGFQGRCRPLHPPPGKRDRKIYGSHPVGGPLFRGSHTGRDPWGSSWMESSVNSGRAYLSVTPGPPATNPVFLEDGNLTSGIMTSIRYNDLMGLRRKTFGRRRKRAADRDPLGRFSKGNTLFQRRNGLKSWKMSRLAGREDAIRATLKAGREKVRTMHRMRSLLKKAGWEIPWPYEGLRQLAENRTPEEIRYALSGFGYLGRRMSPDALVERLLANESRWNPC